MSWKVWREILRLKFSYFLYFVIAVVVYYDWTDRIDGASALLGVMLFWFYYDLNTKDLMLREMNRKKTEE